MSNEEKLIKYTIDHLDEDVSPKDLAGDELGCAESLSNLIQKVLPDFPILLSTLDLFNHLKKDKRFKATLTHRKGVIIVSPRMLTISPTGPSIFGHCGIFITDEKVASNNSKTGKFNGYYTWDSWIEEFVHKRELHIWLFEIL